MEAPAFIRLEEEAERFKYAALSQRQEYFYAHLRSHLNLAHEFRSRLALTRLWGTLVNTDWCMEGVHGVFSLSFRVAGHLCAEFKYGSAYDVESYQYADFSIGYYDKPRDVRTLELLRAIGVTMCAGQEENR